MSSYAFVQSVQDTSQLLLYLKETIPSARSATYDGTTVVIATSVALNVEDSATLTKLMLAYIDPLSGATDSSVNISVHNSTRTPLGSSGIFVGTWEDMSRCSAIMVTTISNVASASAGLQLQFGNMSRQVDFLKSYTTASNTVHSHNISLEGARYMRVVYTNGSVAQTSFSLQVKWSITQVLTTVTGEDRVDSTLSALLTRSMIVGKQQSGTSKDVLIDEYGRVRTRPHVNMLGVTPIIHNRYTYNVNADTNSEVKIGAGTITSSLSRAIVASGAAISSSATLLTRRYVSCPVGQTLKVVVACTFSEGVVGSSQIAGMGTSENGIFFGYNGPTFGLMVRTAGIDTWVAASAFNVDRLNGTGPSSITLDPLQGNTYLLMIDATGYGTVSFCILPPTAATVPEFVTVHRISFANAVTAVDLRNPVAPLMVSAVNTTNATSVSVGVATLSALLDSPPKRVGTMRAADATRTTQSTTYVPILTLLNKATYNSLKNTSSLCMTNVSVASDGTQGCIIVGLYDNCTLSGAAYTDISATTSVAQVDTTATTMTSGVMLHAFPVYTAGNVTVSLADFNIMVPPGSSFTVAVKVTTSGVANRVSVTASWTEDS